MKTGIEARRGGVFELGRVMDPETATQLGARAKDLKNEYLKRNWGIGFGTGISLNICEDRAKGQNELEQHSNGVLLAEDDARLVDGVNERLKEHISLTGLRSHDIAACFFIGAAAGGEWHLDVARDWRMLVNLSDFPISLKVATDWNAGDWVTSSGYFSLKDKVPPKKHVTIDYGPGEAVVVDNACELRHQVPHVGSMEQNKVFLRTIIYEEYDDWA